VTEDLLTLKQRLKEAISGEAFELAAVLQAQITELEPKTPSKLRRQEPGKMGLGTSDQKFKPPAGWTPPTRPDLMTNNIKPRRGGRRR